MKIVEWRIILPVSPEQFERAETYMVGKRGIEEAGNGEGIEFVTREPYEEDGTQGEYTHSVYHYGSRIPGIIRWAVPKSFSDFHEHSWCNFPHSRFKYVVPALEKRVQISMDCYVLSYEREKGFPDNPCHLTPEELAMREIRYMDVVSQPPIPERADWKLGGFKCDEAGISLIPESTRPYDFSKPPEWTENYNGPMVLNAKAIKAHVGIFGVQTKIQNLLACTSVPGILLESARALVGWAPEWANMSKEQIQQYIMDARQKVNEDLKANAGKAPPPQEPTPPAEGDE